MDVGGAKRHATSRRSLASLQVKRVLEHVDAGVAIERAVTYRL
jgi:hypothetical protein